MKKIFLALMLAAASAGFAQERFIEVAVTDTIVMKPTSFKYAVSVGNDEVTAVIGVDTEDEYDYKAAMEMNKQKEAGLKDFLVKKGYKIDANDDSNPYANIFAPGDGLVVTLKNKAEADKLVAEVEKLGYAQARPAGAEYGDESKYDNPLLKKLLDKARKKAEFIAATSGTKLGRIISVKEGKDEDMLSTILNMRNAFDPNGSLGIKSNTLTVRFEVQ
jgi:Protein of unknown function (DUF541)